MASLVAQAEKFEYDFKHAGMKRQFRALILFVLLGAVILLLPLKIGIWLPDVISAPRNVIAEEMSSNGERVRVIQYWNRVDFYSTEFEHIDTNGFVRGFTLDGDDSKSFAVPMKVDWAAKEASVTLGGGRLRRIYWAKGDVEW